MAIAAFLHGVAVHELTHLDGRMGRGHDESFVVAREDLGHATGHLLPAIAVLVTKVLGLPVKPGVEAKRIAALERQLARAKAERVEGRNAQAAVARLQADLAEAQRELAEARDDSARVQLSCSAHCARCDDPAVPILNAAAAALRTARPAGADAEYVEGFLQRYSEKLRIVVVGALAELDPG